MEPTVKLISFTENPIQTIYCLWQESKSNDPIPKPEDVDPNDPEVLKIFEGVVNSHIPVSDFLNFVFVLENISISFREQMVRHRVGMKFGARMSVDILPEINDSSWWGQSMRILDMGKFAQEGRYRTPESLKTHTDESLIEKYHLLMEDIAWFYREAVEKGIPMEDAREVIPLGATHRFSWNLNLTAIKHVIGKRSCWIPQMGIWEPIITGMIDELCTKVHPVFRNLVKPPCISGNKFKECVYKLDNERRISREDETLPCPLYLYHHAPASIMMAWEGRKNLQNRKNVYKKLWAKDPWRWEDLERTVHLEPSVEEGDPAKEGMEGL